MVLFSLPCCSIGSPRLPVKMRFLCKYSHGSRILSQAVQLPWAGVGVRATVTALSTAGEVLPLQPQTEEEVTLQPPRHPQSWESDVPFL